MKKILFVWISVLLAASSCQKLAEDYIGIPMQPNFIDNTGYKKVMNLFGIIHPDSSVFAGSSFICLVQTLPTKGDTTSDPFIKDAGVTVYQTDLSGNTDTIHMQYTTSLPGTRWHVPQYTAPSIHANAGWRYKVDIRHPGYPAVIGETTIPLKPELEDGSIMLDAANVSFTIKSDTATHLYDVYLISDDTTFYQRIVPDKNLPVHVELYPPSQAWNYLVIYAYDRNLSIYYSTSTNSFFSFNTYRPAITTVNGGFGCFGSLNFLEVKL